MLKKKIAIVTVLMLAFCTVGCAKKGTCETCGKTAELYRFTEKTSVMGVGETKTFKVCESCMDEIIKVIDEDTYGLTTYTYEKIN
ncbi:hypothetical protein [Butyrivibrio sp. AC2005]|uniref:hypothetical protein n=1 Tax=Butyrivibrio sp. AC2005 TaxID=1280672 RepID=UPI000419CD7F|nr:hypothetical protein [Butyrivibrio sp. AC2005]